jgi:hypothetical protein
VGVQLNFSQCIFAGKLLQNILREKNGAQDTNGLNGLAFCLDCKTSRDKVGHLFYFLLLPLCEMEKLLGSAVSALKGSSHEILYV